MTTEARSAEDVMGVCLPTGSKFALGDEDNEEEEGLTHLGRSLAEADHYQVYFMALIICSRLHGRINHALTCSSACLVLGRLPGSFKMSGF